MGTLGNWYVPFALVVAVRGCWSPVPVTVTVTPGSTPPDASVALPKMEPRAWAWATEAPAVQAAKTPAASVNTPNRRVMNLLLPFVENGSEMLAAGRGRVN